MVHGIGNINTLLTEDQVCQLLQATLVELNPVNQRILCIIPDGTRTAPIPLFFRLLHQILSPQVKALDFLVALGTHPPMSDTALNQLLGITAEERDRKYQNSQIFNHQWNNPDQLIQLGTITREESYQISQGLLSLDVPVCINRLVLEYDLLLVCGPVFPHEVVGFSGGNKYFFPGISSAEMINYTHWLGALITNQAIIGYKYTPVRAMIERGAALIPRPRYGFCFISSSAGLHGLYCGKVEEAWSTAADLSAQVHVRYLDRPVKKVLAVMPEMYDDLWVGGKGMYKTEPVIDDGGEITIYAPHINEVSYTHGKVLDEIGYHVRDYFVKQWEKYKSYPWGVLAHSTHVKGMGSFANGIEMPRIQVNIASGIPLERIEKIKLNYIDPQSIDLAAWKNDTNPDHLFVPHAGEMLFRLRNP